jgi:hypothetical protein
MVEADDLHLVVCLTDAVDTTNALLHPYRVLRHVVVDQGTEELEVQTLRCRIDAKQNLSIVCLEVTLCVWAENRL